MKIMVKRLLNSIIFLTVLVLVVVGISVASQRLEKDGKKREWALGEWDGGERPYPFSLKERSSWYLEKNGESWDGPAYGNRILTPGNWRWETLTTIPDPVSSALWITKHDPKPHHHMRWGGSWPMPALFAPGGGEATDLYIAATHGFVHVDINTKEVSFIGSPGEGGFKDGDGDSARIEAGISTVDIVSGRVYWSQGNKLRYIEKLLPYRDTRNGKTLFLPAVLDYKNLYKHLSEQSDLTIEPVMNGRKRAKPVFMVRTCSAIKLPVHFPGTVRGVRPLITPDGKGVYISAHPTWKENTNYDNTSLVEIETGKVVAKLNLAGEFPDNMMRPPLGNSDGAGSHGGSCVGFDGCIYTAQHAGCGGGPARLLKIDPGSGRISFLYDSVQGKSGVKRPSRIWDGPADAATLTATSTDFQAQCPRTGAIINGGWDNSGIRRYLDGFVTSIVNGDEHSAEGRPGWGKWTKGNAPNFAHHNSEPALAPNGDMYVADPHSDPQRIVRIFRTDWPKELPVYGYGEKFMPRARLEKLILEYVRDYITRQNVLSK